MMTTLIANSQWKEQGQRFVWSLSIILQGYENEVATTSYT